MAAWYLAADNELLLDIDNPTRLSALRKVPWLETFFRQRLREAMGAGKLDVQSVRLEPSTSRTHVHIIVRLTGPVPTLQRLIWQQVLGSDLYRGRADLMRFALGIDAPSLLILPAPLKGFYRRPDYTCACAVKHDTEQQFALGDRACVVWRKLRGMSPWELFGPSARDPEEWVELPYGDVPLDLIRAKRLKVTRTNRKHR